MTYMPTIMDMTNGKDHGSDLYSYDFTKRRVIHLTGEVNSESAQAVCMQIRYLASKSDDDIYLIINSPGGSVSDGLAIYDAMNGVACDVVTVGTGVAASMGAFLLSSGTKGKRYITTTAEVMIHQPLGGVQGQATDIGLVADRIKRVKNTLAAIIANNCGKTVKKVTGDMERDRWFTAEEAVDYGVADIVGFPDIV